MDLDKINTQWDHCLKNFITKSFFGAAWGFAFGLIFARKKLPVVLYGAGVGGGYSYILCEDKFKDIYKSK